MGFIVTNTNGAHNALSMDTDISKHVLADYTSTNEIWVTIYIEPTVDTPTDFDTDVKTNDFGKLP